MLLSRFPWANQNAKIGNIINLMFNVSECSPVHGWVFILSSMECYARLQNLLDQRDWTFYASGRLAYLRRDWGARNLASASSVRQSQRLSIQSLSELLAAREDF
ncbi:hypothetical protein HBI22_038470 [Parastagonospora nodorum]|nr:hypothetical protein HBI28_025900 [Parastagonospora nodorum]KAH5644285.1 hypothetical protein HBI22_038470 [Parastagonospora nodorum]